MFKTTCLFFLGLLLITNAGCFQPIKKQDVVGEYRPFPANAGYKRLGIYSNGIYECEYYKGGVLLCNSNSWSFDLEGKTENADARLVLFGFRTLDNASASTLGVPIIKKSSGYLQIIIDGRGTIFEKRND